MYDIENWLLTHFIDNALRANYIMILDIDYVVSEDQEILIVDQLLVGPWKDVAILMDSQAVKEGVPVQEETKTSASITCKPLPYVQEVVRDDKTGKPKKKNSVKFITFAWFNSTNRPIARIDHPDLLYPTWNQNSKLLWKMSVCVMKKGQPV